MSEQYFKAKQRFFENLDSNHGFKSIKHIYWSPVFRFCRGHDSYLVRVPKASFRLLIPRVLNLELADHYASDTDQSACQGEKGKLASAQCRADGSETALQTKRCKQGQVSPFPGFYNWVKNSSGKMYL